MSEIRKVIYQWRHVGEDQSGYTTDDTSYSDQAIYEELIKARAVIIKKESKGQKMFFSDNMWQTLTCIELEEVDASECGLIPPSGCKVLKSTCPLPSMLASKNVVSPLGNKVFPNTNWDRLQAKLDNPIESIAKQGFSSVRSVNGKQYLYILNDSYIKVVQKEIIAEDPIIAAQFCGNEEAICDPMGVDFHTQLGLMDPIMKLAWDTILRTRQATKVDNVNNDNNIQ